MQQTVNTPALPRLELPAHADALPPLVMAVTAPFAVALPLAFDPLPA